MVQQVKVLAMLSLEAMMKDRSDLIVAILHLYIECCGLQAPTLTHTVIYTVTRSLSHTYTK